MKCCDYIIEQMSLKYTIECYTVVYNYFFQTVMQCYVKSTNNERTKIFEGGRKETRK